MKFSRVVVLLALLMSVGLLCALRAQVEARSDPSEVEDEDSRVETEDEVIDDGQAEPGTGPAEARGQHEAQGGATDETPKEEGEVAVKEIGPASDVETNILFTKFPQQDELPAGQLVHCLVSLQNKGTNEKSYVVESLYATLRYPMDYSFYLQNFSRIFPNQSVDANREATFSYTFRTSDHFSGRPFGLVIELDYTAAAAGDKDEMYRSAAFNKTINFVESDNSFDGQAILLYLFFGALAALLVLIVYYAMFGGKKGGRKGRGGGQVEVGTRQANGAVHDEWLPAHARDSNKPPGSGSHKSPKSKGTPPRTKKSKKD